MGDKKDAIKFKLDVPVTGKFDFTSKDGDTIFDSPLQGTATGKDGEEFDWFMYTFIDEAGEKKVFFPSKGLQKTLSEAGKLHGKSFVITKVLAKDDDGNTAENAHGQPILEFKVEFPDAGKEEVSAEDAGFIPDIESM